MELIADNTILYSDLGQRIQTWNPLNGHIPIPATTNISSVMLFGENKESHVVLPYSIVYPPSYFSVSHHSIVTVRKNNVIYHGALYAIGDGKRRSVTLRMATGNAEKALTIYDYDTIEEIGSSPQHEDTIYIIPSQSTSHPSPLGAFGSLQDARDRPAFTGPMTITYLIDFLTWQSSYTVLLRFRPRNDCHATFKCRNNEFRFVSIHICQDIPISWVGSSGSCPSKNSVCSKSKGFFDDARIRCYGGNAHRI